MKGQEVRQRFIDYFKKQGHTPVASSRLIPENDDTLLFANAGMNQFKNLFLGLEKRSYSRAVSSQKCVRAGGKHNDLENVGFTARHHTFFEMLGNFSFGDYFKKDAIRFSWEFLTKELKIPKDKLYITVFREDDEASDIWHKQEGIPLDRISRFDEADNFWTMGDTGPCGPCSEIFYDHGSTAGCGKSSCKVGCSCDRYVEIWNLVFMQYNQSADGKRTPLPNPSIDTGSGLERLTAVMQGVPNNYETDLFTPLISKAKELTAKKIKLNATEALSASRVIADHARATAFLIADGALPSNEGRDYVLRRIMRRAMRFGRQLNAEASLLLPIVQKVIEGMSSFYPELKAQRALIEATVKGEEERFFQTLDQGTTILEQEIQRLKSKKQKAVSGEVVFKLYDTFGFPMDLTRLMATEAGLEIDEAGFNEQMEKARAVAKSSWKGSGLSHNATHLIQLIQGLPKTEFTGYEETETQKVKVLQLSSGSEAVTALSATGTSLGILITDRTCFYAESGGQVGDQGRGHTGSAQFEVLDCTKQGDIHLHHIKVTKGELKANDLVTLVVNESERRSTMRHHSATHLLHSALREVLGVHVSQAGSLVAADRLRFDFTHNKPVSKDEIKKIEDLVNHEISMARTVHHEVMAYKKALEAGAMALFGEKYGDEVRVIKMGEFSTELCGGTHVHNTSDIRLFKVVSESGVSAGVRRLEALTGDQALQFLLTQNEQISRAREVANLNVSWTKILGIEGEAPSLEAYIQQLQGQVKALEKEVKAARGQSVNVEAILSKAETVNGTALIFESLDIDDRDVLRELSDKLRDKIKSGVVVLVGKASDSLPITVALSKDLVGKYHAGKILQSVAAELGGKGGGRPDFAQGAGKDPSLLNAAHTKTKSLL